MKDFDSNERGDYDWNRSTAYDQLFENEFVKTKSLCGADLLTGLVYAFMIYDKRTNSERYFTDGWYLGVNDNCFDKSYRFVWSSHLDYGDFCLDLEEDRIYKSFKEPFDDCFGENLSNSVETNMGKRVYLSNRFESIEERRKLFNDYNTRLKQI